MRKLISLDEKIFIAGATGMAGGAIKKQLKLSGYGKALNKGILLTPNRKELDLLEAKLVEDWFKKNKPTVVVIAAAKVGGIIANTNSPTEFLLDNLKIQNNIIENSWKFGVKRLLFLGSSCIYPKFASQPIKEEYLLSNKLEPTNEAYAIAKIAGIKLCQSLRKQYNFDAISLMPTNLYGHGDNYHPSNSHVFAALIKKFCDAKKHLTKEVTCWGSGNPLREFLHVEDLGKAVVFALENWDPNSNEAPKDENNKPIDFLNVGTGKDISIFNLAKLIAKKVGYEGKIIWDHSKPDGTPRKLLNVEKLKNLGWNAETDIEQGIEITIKNYCQIRDNII